MEAFIFLVMVGVMAEIKKIMKFSILFTLLFLEACSALYFHMGETEKKCFLEEIPDETMVTGKSIYGLYI